MTQRIRRLGVAVALAAGSSALLAPGHAGALPTGAPKIGMVCTPGTLASGTRTFNLTASTGHIQTPDGNSVFMWSYANADDPDPVLRAFQSPGPVLCATQGETVVVSLTNNLPEPTSVVFPGQDAAVTPSGGVPGLLTTEAAGGGGTVSYSFTAGSPGTYLYESGSDVAKQVEMGLYGALIVRPSAGANLAYGSTTQFNPAREFLLLLADIDPFLHHAVETNATYDFNSRNNRYFTINGRSFPDTVQDNGSSLLPNQPYGALVRIRPNSPASNPDPALIRMVNVGVDNHPFHPHGNHTRQIAQDGRPLASPTGGSASTEHFGESIGAGQTEDFMLRWDNQSTDTSGSSFNDDWSPDTNPLPVAQPNYRNLTFKDGNTYYAGSPYMGYKGTLPTGTVSQNVCGEWYFPLHSHALNEFTNFDEGFGGMGTLLRVDPAGGCFGSAASTTIVNGVLKSGSPSALASDDANYYQVNPKTTTVTPQASTSLTAATSATATTISVASKAGFPANNFPIQIQNELLQVTGNPTATTWTVQRGQFGSTGATHANGSAVSLAVSPTASTVKVSSAAGFPPSGTYYVRIDNEVLAVTAGQGTTTWTVSRGQLGTAAAVHAANATVTALANDWYGSFTGVAAGSQNLKVTYKGKNCANTTGTGCTAIASNLPRQTVKVCNWTIPGGCSTATSAGWVTLQPGTPPGTTGPAQPQSVGSTDVSSTWTLPGSASAYVGTGANSGQVRVLVHTDRWTAPSPTAFSTWGNLMSIVYDAP
jgi:FtsP/CotA-like multicopper oxidase with cupredoxin domain